MASSKFSKRRTSKTPKAEWQQNKPPKFSPADALKLTLFQIIARWPGLSPYDRAVANYIAAHFMSKSRVYLAQRTIADALGISVRQVRLSCEVIEAEGILRIIREQSGRRKDGTPVYGSPGKANVYEFPIDLVLEERRRRAEEAEERGQDEEKSAGTICLHSGDSLEEVAAPYACTPSRVQANHDNSAGTICLPSTFGTGASSAAASVAAPRPEGVPSAGGVAAHQPGSISEPPPAAARKFGADLYDDDGNPNNPTGWRNASLERPEGLPDHIRVGASVSHYCYFGSTYGWNSCCFVEGFAENVKDSILVRFEETDHLGWVSPDDLRVHPSDDESEPEPSKPEPARAPDPVMAVPPKAVLYSRDGVVLSMGVPESEPVSASQTAEPEPSRPVSRDGGWRVVSKEDTDIWEALERLRSSMSEDDWDKLSPRQVVNINGSMVRVSGDLVRMALGTDPLPSPVTLVPDADPQQTATMPRTQRRVPECDIGDTLVTRKGEPVVLKSMKGNDDTWLVQHSNGRIENVRPGALKLVEPVPDAEPVNGAVR